MHILVVAAPLPPIIRATCYFEEYCFGGESRSSFCGVCACVRVPESTSVLNATVMRTSLSIHKLFLKQTMHFSLKCVGLCMCDLTYYGYTDSPLSYPKYTHTPIKPVKTNIEIGLEFSLRPDRDACNTERKISLTFFNNHKKQAFAKRDME